MEKWSLATGILYTKPLMVPQGLNIPYYLYFANRDKGNFLWI